MTTFNSKTLHESYNPTTPITVARTLSNEYITISEGVIEGYQLIQHKELQDNPELVNKIAATTGSKLCTNEGIVYWTEEAESLWMCLRDYRGGIAYTLKATEGLTGRQLLRAEMHNERVNSVEPMFTLEAYNTIKGFFFS